ncbi:HU family DNA-binding protein [Catenovulum sediminis]|uniref:HU family DNA-binding protein n=1 Tax=Catenovulum sediminis TaxID=1740262 RepID=A0ABV1RCL0_9ALTE
MNKSQLVEQIATQADITKADANRAVDALVDAVKAELAEGGKVDLVGFGSFSVSKRNARTGRNPQTGETIQIAASTIPKFKPGKALKDAVNS